MNDAQLLLENKVTYKSKSQITLIVFNITLSSFYFGYCIVYLGSTPISTYKDIYHITLEDSSTEGLLNGCIPIGALFGALGSSLLISRFSRRNCLLYVNIFAFFVGVLLYIPNFYSLVFFRVCQGLCVGFYSSIVPLIIKEFSPLQISGSLGTLTQLNVTLGVFFGAFFPYLLRKITGDQTARQYWHIVFGFPQVTILIQTIVLLFVYPYETPKYLISVGKQEEAKKLIVLIYKPQYVQEIFEQKKADVKPVTSSSKLIPVDTVVTSTSQQPARKNNPITIIVAYHLAVLQQFCGVNAVAIYGGKIARQATSGELALLVGSIINFEQTLGCFITGFALAKFGRKTILQFGSFSIGVSCLLITIGFFIKETSPDASEALILLGLFTFMLFFGFSLGPIVWLYIPEIVQPNIVPISTAFNWTAASLVVILFPIISDGLFDGNPKVLFAFFTIWLFASGVFNHLFVVETKNKQQKDIAREYQRVKLC